MGGCALHSRIPHRRNPYLAKFSHSPAHRPLLVEAGGRCRATAQDLGAGRGASSFLVLKGCSSPLWEVCVCNTPGPQLWGLSATPPSTSLLPASCPTAWPLASLHIHSVWSTRAGSFLYKRWGGVEVRIRRDGGSRPNSAGPHPQIQTGFPHLHLHPETFSDTGRAFCVSHLC